jgi:hypothetical protein
MGKDGDGDEGWSEGDGDGKGGEDEEGFGDGLGDGLDALGLGDGFDEGEVTDTAGAGSRAGVVGVSAVGEEEDTLTLGDGLEDGFGEEADGEDGWSEICCTAATEWAEVRGPGPRAASAAPPAATMATVLTAIAAFNPRTLRNREIRSTVLPWSAGGRPAGHSAASSSAASPRCDRPRWCQSRP